MTLDTLKQLFYKWNSGTVQTGELIEAVKEVYNCAPEGDLATRNTCINMYHNLIHRAEVIPELMTRGN